MNDQQKIRQLEERNKALERVNEDNRKTIESLLKPPEITRCHLRKIGQAEAEKGFDYPSNLRNIWVDYRNGDLFLIVPTPKSEGVK